MWLKNKKMNILSDLINRLMTMLEKSNYVEWSYILGSKKEIIKRNILAGIARGVGIRDRYNNNNSDINYTVKKGCYFKYTCDR